MSDLDTGVSCADCKLSVNLGEHPHLYFEGDDRLKKMFTCKGLPHWKWFHADLSHQCGKHIPIAEIRPLPLPDKETRMQLEQEVVDPQNEMMSAKAVGYGIARMQPNDGYKALQKIIDQSKVALQKNPSNQAAQAGFRFVKLVSGFVDEYRTKKKQNPNFDSPAKAKPMMRNR